MMFSRDIHDYRAAPRTMQTSKFGPYSKLTIATDHALFREVCEYLGYIVIGFLIGSLISTLGYWGYRWLCAMVAA